MSKLPTFLLEINEDEDSALEVNYTALVDKPAIQRDFHYFNSKKRFEFNSERGIVSGALMIPDMPIYRFTPEQGEFYVMFTKETILKIVKKVFKKGMQNNFNIMHDQPVEGITMFESFISDASRGIQPMKGHEDLPDGTWYGSAFVENEDLRKQIKEGKFKGFSVEGYFVPKLVDDQTKIDMITALLKKEGFLSEK
jgi:(2Fe-2S) ferredoxin